MSTATEQPVFDCPHCGGEIQYDGQSVTQRCTYCGTAVPVPQEFRPAVTPSIQVVTPLEYSKSSRRASSTGCMVLVIGFVVFMVLATVVLPIVLTNQASSNIPDMPSALNEMATAAANLKSEPTRRPPTAVPSPTPTPAFADVQLQFGEKGMGPGQFTNAHLSGLDGKGQVYVGEYAGGRIQAFDATGKFINQFFVGDEQTDLLGLAVDRNGVVYATDGGDITRYDGKTGKMLGKLNYSGGPGFGELALAPDGSLYAMWYERRNGIFTSVEGAREDLVHFNANGKVLNVVKGVISSMTDSVELDNALAIDGRGNVYLAAGFEQTIFKFDPKGKFVTRIGSSGSSQFQDVGAIALDGQGRIFVVENGGISVLKPDGSRLGRIKVAGAVRQLLFDDAGALWITTDDGVLKYHINQN